MTKASNTHLAFCFLAKPIGRPITNNKGNCLNTIQDPSWIINQILYHNESEVANAPNTDSFINKVASPTITPAKENSNTGVNIAPPNRWTFCIICFKTFSP